MDGPLEIRVRSANAADLGAVLGLDAHPDRSDEIAAAVSESRCLVAETDGLIRGFTVRARFFGNEFLELVEVDPAQRRRGIATALVRHLAETSTTDKLFTSTNQSNTAMRRLCDGLGFVRSGIVENLDEGDPELIYFKRVRRRSPLHPAG